MKKLLKTLGFSLAVILIVGVLIGCTGEESLEESQDVKGGKEQSQVEPKQKNAPAPKSKPKSQPQTTPSASCNCSGPDLDCSDFASHSEAQSCFDYCYSQVGYDIFRLDADSDGSACEAL